MTYPLAPVRVADPLGGTMSHMDFVREALDFDRNDRLEHEAWQNARAERTITPPGPAPSPLPPVRVADPQRLLDLQAEEQS